MLETGSKNAFMFPVLCLRGKKTLADMVKNDAVQFTCVVRVYCITSSDPLFLLILVSGKASSVERKNKKLESRPRGAI